MPSSSCSGVKLTEDSRLAVSHCTSRRMTCASCCDGLPYGRTATPSPSTRVHSGTFGGRFLGLPARVGPLANAAPALVATLRKRRRVGRLAPLLSMASPITVREECSTSGADRETLLPENYPRRDNGYPPMTLTDVLASTLTIFFRTTYFSTSSHAGGPSVPSFTLAQPATVYSRAASMGSPD